MSTKAEILLIVVAILYFERLHAQTWAQRSAATNQALIGGAGIGFWCLPGEFKMLVSLGGLAAGAVWLLRYLCQLPEKRRTRIERESASAVAAKVAADRARAWKVAEAARYAAQAARDEAPIQRMHQGWYERDLAEAREDVRSSHPVQRNYGLKMLEQLKTQTPVEYTTWLRRSVFHPSSSQGA